METPSWTTLAAAWLATATLFLLTTHLRRQRKLPPGPTPWPIIGNLNLIGSLPHRSFHSLSRKYGPIMHLRFGSVAVIVGSSADIAKVFLKTMDVTFASRKQSAAGKLMGYDYSGITWSSYGPYWRQVRRISLMEMLSAKHLESYEYIRVEEMKALLKGLHDKSGELIMLKDRLSTVGLNIISRMMLGKRFTDDIENALVKPEELKKMLDEFFLLSGVFNIGDSIPWLDFLDLQGYIKRMKIVAKKVDRFWEHELDEHNARKKEEGENFVAKDMVDFLLQHADDPNLEVKLERHGVKAIAQELLAGGFGSPAVAVEWAFSELLSQPEIFEKVTEELDRVIGRDRWVDEKDFPNLPFVDAIIKETMRLHPIGPVLSRLANENCKVSGYDIEKGTRVIMNVWGIQRDPTLWDQPNEFRPERFIGRTIDIKGKDFELLPFGSGRRMCPGNMLGLKMTQSSLANLLHGFTWSLPDGIEKEDVDMEEVFGLSMPKMFPLAVVAKPRLPLPMYAT